MTAVISIPKQFGVQMVEHGYAVQGADAADLEPPRYASRVSRPAGHSLKKKSQPQQPSVSAERFSEYFYFFGRGGGCHFYVLGNIDAAPSRVLVERVRCLCVFSRSLFYAVERILPTHFFN